MICGKCHVLCADICPNCGKTKYLREPKADEPVFLMTLSSIKSILFVEPVLDDNGIVYHRVGTLGYGLTSRWGAKGEMYRYYVAYADFNRVRNLIEEIFGEDEEIMRALNEYNSAND